MLLREIMTSGVVTVHMDDTLDRIRQIFERSRFHHLIVTDNGRVVGVISDRDVLKHLSPFVGQKLMERSQDTNTLKKKAHQIMHRRPVVGREDMSVQDATGLFIKEGVTCLPIVDRNYHVCGIITWRDILPHCFHQCSTTRNAA